MAADDRLPFSMEEMTWPEVAEAVRQELPVLLAVGSTEQHGPHLPLATDSLLPVAIAGEAAKRYPMVVAPPIRFGAFSRPLSGGGEAFPGTLSLRASTLIETIRQVLEGLARAGFRKLCLMNWHYENSGFLWEAADLASAAHADAKFLLLEDPMPQLSDAELDDIFPGGFLGWGVEHASVVETSLMHVFHPELVHGDRAVDDHSERSPTWDVIPPPPEFLTQSGVLANATRGSEEFGRMFLDQIVERLVEALTTEFGPPATGGASGDG